MIPISKPVLGAEEKEAIARVLEKGYLAQGEDVEHFEQEFARYIGTKFAIATNSGTSALHIALASLGIGEGDEVITTAFSFFATASCILMQRATPVFGDIDPQTYNIDPYQIEPLITERTRAIIPVHLYGQPCNMEPILEVAQKYNLYVVEDACQAHGAEYKGKRAGSIGHLGVFSFYPTKNMTTGEGGMITTSDPEITQRARMLRNQGQAERYRHEALGYNYRMTNIAAAIGSVQLSKLESFNQKRIDNAAYYNRNLRACPFIAPDVRHVFHQYTIRVNDREAFTKHLEQRGIGYGIYYPIPLHHQPPFERYNNRSLPQTEKASQEVISLPINPSLSQKELEQIVEAVNSYAGW